MTGDPIIVHDAELIPLALEVAGDRGVLHIPDGMYDTGDHTTRAHADRRVMVVVAVVAFLAGMAFALGLAGRVHADDGRTVCVPDGSQTMPGWICTTRGDPAPRWFLTDPTMEGP